jgi:hypothetical protein
MEIGVWEGVAGSRSDELNGDPDGGVWLDFDTAHPDDGAGDVEDRPVDAIRACNFHAFKDFLDFSGTRGITEAHAVAGLPGAKDSFR